MPTPESKVKAKVKRILKQYEPMVYTHWPVQAGYGSPTLDCVGSIKPPWMEYGIPFTVETKRPGQKPTPRQLHTMRMMKQGGYKVFLIDGEKYPYTILETWLARQFKRP